MEEYRRPFLESGDGRWPTLQWPREAPLSGDPADVHDRIFAYSTWLNTASLPKLFIDADLGVFITGRVKAGMAGKAVSVGFGVGRNLVRVAHADEVRSNQSAAGCLNMTQNVSP
jgi:hypothetical protein